MSQNIHPTAIVDSSAIIGEGVNIGPYCIIGPHVHLGDNCRLHAHVVLDGRTTIGAGNEFFPFSSIGTIPQDLKYNGEPTRLEIGDNNRFREHVTVNCGTVGDQSLTKIGDNNLLMVGVHIAHDCVIGNNNVLANNATMAGHVKVGNFVVIGGLSAAHQFVRIGDYAMIGGMSGVENDVIPYGLVMGERAKLAGLNLVGLERRGFERSDMQLLMKVFKRLFLSEDLTFRERLNEIKEAYTDNQVVSHMIEFATSENSRPLCQAK